MQSSRYSTPLRILYIQLSYDNGREFSHHGEIAKQLNCGTHKAKPYPSWEHGLNESYNGLLRQLFPKKMKLDKITYKEVKTATDLMNNRSRKYFGFKTPLEVFTEMMGKDCFFTVLYLWVEFSRINKVAASENKQ